MDINELALEEQVLAKKVAQCLEGLSADEIRQVLRAICDLLDVEWPVGISRN